MSDKTRRRLGTAALALGFAVLYFILVLTAIHAVGTDDALYFELQSRERAFYSAWPPWGVFDDTLRMLDERLAAYLAGDARALEEPGTDAATGLRAQVWGEWQPAFNDRERAHLRDCYELFALLRRVRARLIPWAVLLIAGGAYLLRDRRRIRRCAWLSPLALLMPLGAFAIYAASDFDAAFTLFHEALFANDLWLLDPRTDLLIRICPESMFRHMGVRIGIYSLIGIVAVSAVATLLTFIWPRGKEENTWNNRDMRRGPAPKRIDYGRRGAR